MDKIIEELRGLASQSADGNITIHAPTLADRLETCCLEKVANAFEAGAGIVMNSFDRGVSSIIFEMGNAVKEIKRITEGVKNETR